MSVQSPVRSRTRVAIVGAGPAGLLLGHLLHRRGIDTVILESRTREYVERRQRAGILEQGTVDVLRESGAGDRMDRVGLRHEGIELRFDRESHRIDFPTATGGRSVMVYAQTEVVKDLIALRLRAGTPLLFEAEALALDGISTDTPSVRYRHEGVEHHLSCDVIVACDGFHGIGRRSIPPAVMRVFERVYPFSWLGILADVAPSCDELIYAYHRNGFALHSMRSATISRLYLQVDPDEDPANWPDERIWDELATRLAIDGDWTLRRGAILEKGVTPMRSFVAEPMRHGRLFLAGDAAHIVPPTGAKGLNLAAADVTLLAAGLHHSLVGGDDTLLDAYSDTALRRVWRTEHFSWSMTTMLHRVLGQDPFDDRLQLAQLHYTATSAAASSALAENYVGIPLPGQLAELALG